MATHSVSLPGEFQGQRSLVGYSLWGHKESDTTERLNNNNKDTSHQYILNSWLKDSTTVSVLAEAVGSFNIQYSVIRIFSIFRANTLKVQNQWQSHSAQRRHAEWTEDRVLGSPFQVAPEADFTPSGAPAHPLGQAAGPPYRGWLLGTPLFFCRM